MSDALITSSAEELWDMASESELAPPSPEDETAATDVSEPEESAALGSPDAPVHPASASESAKATARYIATAGRTERDGCDELDARFAAAGHDGRTFASASGSCASEAPNLRKRNRESTQELAALIKVVLLGQGFLAFLQIICI